MDIFNKELGPCYLNIVEVILDRFHSGHKHYVCQIGDNWISKEFMSRINYSDEELV